MISNTAFSQSVLSKSDWIENRSVPIRSILENERRASSRKDILLFPGYFEPAGVKKPEAVAATSVGDSSASKSTGASLSECREIDLLAESQTPIHFFPYPFFLKNQPLTCEQKAKLLGYMAREAAEKGDSRAAAGYLLQQAEVAHPDFSAQTEQILNLLESIENAEELQILEEKYSHIDFVREELPYLRLNLLLKQEEYILALSLIETLLSQLQKQRVSEKLEYLSSLQNHINLILSVNPKRIGVILPLSSTNPQIAPLAREAMQGLRLGLIAFSEVKESGRRTGDSQVGGDGESFELIFRDSLLNAESSAAAVRELIEEEHVIAIIGPLIRRTSESAAREAQRLQVPLISLSLTASIPHSGSFVFRNNENWEQEMKVLARYAYDYKNARRFLILYPESREGKYKMNLFWQEVERLGGTIVGGESFELGQENFIRHFESFTGLNRFIDPQDKIILDKFEEEQQPVRDFDALFVPIGRNHLEDLKVLLPYSTVYKMGDIFILGDSGWNDYAILPTIEKYVGETVFVDSFFKQIQQPQMQRFLRLHELFYMHHLNYRGPTSYTAYAFDTVNLLQNLLSSQENRNYRQLQQALLHMEPYAGVTGMITFSENGEAQREMKLLTVRSGKIVPVN